MVTFRVVQPVAAPPPYVIAWWLDYREEDAALTPGFVRRSVQRIDSHRVHLSTTNEFGGRLRTTDGTVTRTGDAAWQMSGHVISDGRTVSTLQTSYWVEAAEEGSRVVADFEFVGRTWPWRLALSLSGVSLRRRQRRAFQDYALAIEKDFRAGAVPIPLDPPSPEGARPSAT